MSNNKTDCKNEQIDISEELKFNKLSIVDNTFANMNDLDKHVFFSEVFETVFNIIPEAQKGSFYELEGEIYKPIFCKGYDFDLLSQLTFNKDEAFIDFNSPSSQIVDAYQVVIQKREDKLFSERQIEIFKKLGTYSNFASLYAPIKFDDLKIGLLCIENFDMKTFSETSRLVLKVYAQLVSNYYSLKIHQQRENNRYKEMINALVTAIEVKDEYTEGHAKRVSELSLKLAKIMGIPDNRLKTIEAAAILHDIGKIGTPTEILNKKTSLTAYEYEIIKKHPFDAKKILEKIEGFDEIQDITYMHHEHFDGSGYPQGLSGEQIPIEAHIIQAADSFDAMTSKRAYRDAMSIEKALSIFKEQRGKQFHPVVTDAMLSLFAK